jgi:ketosteroid isomerase-like protein
VDVNERIVRDFYAARAQRDSNAVGRLLAPDVVWWETGGVEDYVGEQRGRVEGTTSPSSASRTAGSPRRGSIRTAATPQPSARSSRSRTGAPNEGRPFRFGYVNVACDDADAPPTV